MRRRRLAPTGPPERRVEAFKGAERWREIHALYDGGNKVDGWFLETCTWSRDEADDPDERTGVAVFIRATPNIY